MRHNYEINFVIFEDRSPIGAFGARLRAQNLKCSKMVENHKKIGKKIDFFKKKHFVNKRPLRFFKCFRHVFRPFVTCKVFRSDLTLVKSVSTVSPTNVYSQNVFFFEKIDFLMIFDHF